MLFTYQASFVVIIVGNPCSKCIPKPQSLILVGSLDTRALNYYYEVIAIRLSYLTSSSINNLALALLNYY